MHEENLAQAAIKFENLLIHYSKSYKEAQEVYDSCKALLEKVKSKKLSTPISDGWFHIYLEPGYPLAEIEDLSQAAAEFSVLLEGWDSLEDFRRDFSEMEKQAKEDEAQLRSQLEKKK